MLFVIIDDQTSICKVRNEKKNGSALFNMNKVFFMDEGDN